MSVVYRVSLSPAERGTVVVALRLMDEPDLADRIESVTPSLRTDEEIALLLDVAEAARLVCRPDIAAAMPRLANALHALRARTLGG